MQKAFLIIVFAGVSVAYAQPFSSGSTGSDGALNLTAAGTVDFDPAALGLNPAGDNIFNFTTINIGPGVTVRMRASKLRQKSVVWLATGAVTIAGTLDLSGAAGHPPGVMANLRVPSEPGPGGYPGGVGRTDSSPAQPGGGPGGGSGCASYATAGCFGAGPVYGNSLLVPLRGGSGGGGSNAISLGGGAAGGGAIQIVSNSSISISGTILANGGSAANDQYGGPGSGGAIHLEAPTISGNGSAQAVGGNAPFCCGFGGASGNGWIRVDTTANNFTGTFSPGPTFGPLFNMPLPSAVPTVAITSINGTAVPSQPTGSFTSPDITINSGNAVPVTIAASNIPLGTVVKLIVSSETGTDQTVSASPLSGAVSSSTASANILWPLGVSRVFIRATW